MGTRQLELGEDWRQDDRSKKRRGGEMIGDNPSKERIGDKMVRARIGERRGSEKRRSLC